MESFNSNVAELPVKAAAKPAMPSVRRFSHLSVPRQVLVRLCQATNYGQIRNLRVRDSEPVFSSPPVVTVDVKLDADEGPRAQVDLPDFELCDEVRRLMARLDDLKNATIERIDVRGGIPRRILFERPILETRSDEFALAEVLR